MDIIHVIEHNSNRLRLYVPMCFENALISYSKTMNENYKAAFIDYWNFLYYRKADNNSVIPVTKRKYILKVKESNQMLCSMKRDTKQEN